MTKKDYILIAQCIADSDGLFDRRGERVMIYANELVDLLAERLGEENPLFNADRFRDACAYEH